MPKGGTWRTVSAYDYINDLDPPDLAWEFLRRNGAYREEYAEATQAGSLDPKAAAALARRWGLSFRYGPGSDSARNTAFLDPAREPSDDPPGAIAIPAGKLPIH